MPSTSGHCGSPPEVDDDVEPPSELDEESALVLEVEAPSSPAAVVLDPSWPSLDSELTAVDVLVSPASCAAGQPIASTPNTTASSLRIPTATHACSHAVYAERSVRRAVTPTTGSTWHVLNAVDASADRWHPRSGTWAGFAGQGSFG